MIPSDEKLCCAIMDGEADNKQHFYEKLQLVVKDRRHRIVSVVPLESSNNNRLRHLVLLSGPLDGGDNNNTKQQR